MVFDIDSPAQNVAESMGYPRPDVCVDPFPFAQGARQNAGREWASSAWKEMCFVYTSRIGTPMDERRVLLEFLRLVKAAELPTVS